MVSARLSPTVHFDATAKDLSIELVKEPSLTRPRLPLPDQLATTDTTEGQPVDWNAPAHTYCMHGRP